MTRIKLPYRVFPYGLILMLVASFSLPTIAVCAMAGQDCHDEMTEMASGCCGDKVKAVADNDCHDPISELCGDMDCTLKQTPAQANLIELTQAQINEAEALVVSFIISVLEPEKIYEEIAADFSAQYANASPIYLMNRVLLN